MSNGLILLLAAKLVRGFTASGFWTALFASLFLNSLMPDVEMAFYRSPPSSRSK